MPFQIQTTYDTFLADVHTPVAIYLSLRDLFAETLLLEHYETGPAGGISYICCQPVSSILVSDNRLQIKWPDGRHSESHVPDGEVQSTLAGFCDNFRQESQHPDFENGLFGYFAYDSIKYFHGITVSEKEQKIADVRLSLYKYVIVFNHFKSQVTLVHNYLDTPDADELQLVRNAIINKQLQSYPFKVTAPESSNMSDDDYEQLVKKGIRHCLRGDVFQIVLSRRFQVKFEGDEFNVYRTLRSINPSQYLFFFDYGDYRLFGSSPESQLRMHPSKATLHPIAGTYRRTGNPEEDEELALKLLADKKELAEHVMLVDLARNDLSKTYTDVQVTQYQQIQQLSHVLHIASEVTGKNPVSTLSPVTVLANTFPAGTLSGAPKHMAMQLISSYEPTPRGFYGGSIGFVGFNSTCNQAILIRAFLSQNNTLTYQAGAGVVAASIPENELQEVNNKIAALRRAVSTAQEL